VPIKQICIEINIWELSLDFNDFINFCFISYSLI
jgi:hypothetical protein